ncbi:hypothetical protein [Micromonospora sp. CPCC 206061]|uniref:hypothetical protein n=1 Tax=Micromonospora sp. CPCC 206061 TaxID=3122410 RepID=UPI002FF39CCF
MSSTRHRSATSHRTARGPNPVWRQRVRAAQAFAAATDPIGQFPDVPPHDLRAELLRGATTILSSPVLITSRPGQAP